MLEGRICGKNAINKIDFAFNSMNFTKGGCGCILCSSKEQKKGGGADRLDAHPPARSEKFNFVE